MAFQQPPDSVIDNDKLDRDEYLQLDAGPSARSTGLVDFQGVGPGEVGKEAEVFDEWTDAGHTEDYFPGHENFDAATQPLLSSYVDPLDPLSEPVPQRDRPMLLFTASDVSLHPNDAGKCPLSFQTPINGIVESDLSTVYSPGLQSPLVGVSDHARAECGCLTCFSFGVKVDWKALYEWKRSEAQGESDLLTCRYPGCSYLFDSVRGSYRHWTYRPVHERSHFEAVDASGVKKFHCNVESCNFSSKKWGDLLRHCTTKHCTNPNIQIFPCPDLACKYAGANGFTRKDKLKSHLNVHRGFAVPGKAPRALEPKPAAGA